MHLLHYVLVDKEKEVIIKVLPLPIPVGMPVPAPVHVGVPAVPPFTSSYPYSQYQAQPVGVLGPRMDNVGSEQVANRRSADADHSIIGGHSGGLSDTRTTTMHSRSTFQRPPAGKDYFFGLWPHIYFYLQHITYI